MEIEIVEPILAQCFISISPRKRQKTRFYDIFRRHRNGTLDLNGLSSLIHVLIKVKFCLQPQSHLQLTTFIKLKVRLTQSNIYKKT